MCMCACAKEWERKKIEKRKKELLEAAFGIEKIFRQYTAIKQMLTECCVNTDQILILGIRIIAKRNVDFCSNVLDIVSTYIVQSIQNVCPLWIYIYVYCAKMKDECYKIENWILPSTLRKYREK